MQFDFIAPYYDAISRIVFGTVLEKAKITHFGNITNGSRVLFIGGGSGSSLASLLQTRDDLKTDFVDSSQKMISIAKKRVLDSFNVSFYHIPVEQFDGSSYDFIITEFFFDLFDKNKTKELIEIIASKLTKDGKWIDTDFRESSKLKNKIILKLMYKFFNISAKLKSNKLVHTNLFFIKAGYEITHECKFNSGFISSRLLIRP